MGSTAAGSSSSSEAAAPQGFFARIVQFFREVIGELKKVTYPTGPELVRYTLVVLAFVVVMMLLVTGLDYVFGRGAMWVFGGSSGN